VYVCSVCVMYAFVCLCVVSVFVCLLLVIWAVKIDQDISGPIITEEGNGNLLQYFLGKFHFQGSLEGYSHGVTKSWIRPSY